jgi:hypothetical protein
VLVIENKGAVQTEYRAQHAQLALHVSFYTPKLKGVSKRVVDKHTPVPLRGAGGPLRVRWGSQMWEEGGAFYNARVRVLLCYVRG